MTRPTKRKPRRRHAAQIAVTPTGPRALPELAPWAPLRTPRVQDVLLDNGLRAITLRQPSTPMVEMRLYIPFGNRPRGRAATHAARAELLAATMLLGNHWRNRDDIDGALADIGGRLEASANPHRLLIVGNCLAGSLAQLLKILAECLCGPSYLSETVAPERDRLLEQLAVSAQQPSLIARQALQRKRFGDHAASYEVPDAHQVARTTAPVLRLLHDSAVLPGGSTLTLVGDLRNAAALDAAARELDAWRGEGPAYHLLPPPQIQPAPIDLIDRSGAVQSQVRLSLPAVGRDDPDYPALQVANMVYGGYFSSRLMTNIREDKGFTYSASSGLEFWPQQAAIGIQFDTATSVTAAAINEARYELGRLALTGPTQQEVEAARNYLLGTLATSQANQSGRAALLTTVYANGLDAAWITGYARALARIGVDAVANAAARYLAPAGLTGIVAGDMSQVGDQLRGLGI